MNLDALVSEFGKSLGMPDLSMASGGGLCLEFEQMGTLYMEPAENTLMIGLARQVPPYKTSVFKRALERCHYMHGAPFEVHPGYKEPDQLFFTVRLDEKDQTLAGIEQAMTLLASCHETVADR